MTTSPSLSFPRKREPSCRASARRKSLLRSRALALGLAGYATNLDDGRVVVVAEGSITLSRLRDELGTSRKYAQALLEHLDAARVTRRREDDSRVLRASSGVLP